MRNFLVSFNNEKELLWVINSDSMNALKVWMDSSKYVLSAALTDSVRRGINNTYIFKMEHILGFIDV